MDVGVKVFVCVWFTVQELFVCVSDKRGTVL